VRQLRDRALKRLREGDVGRALGSFGGVSRPEPSARVSESSPLLLFAVRITFLPGEKDADSDTQREPVRVSPRHSRVPGAESSRQRARGFGGHTRRPDTRSAFEILAHVGDLMEWPHRLRALTPLAGADEERAGTKRSKGFSRAPRRSMRFRSGNVSHADENRLIQGPLADALTHVGQINVLRRIAGTPVRGENYAQAKITIGPWGRSASAGEGVRLIKLVDIHKSFGDRNVLDGFTLDVAEGETMVIIGYSERGKSVAIKHIVGLLEPDSERSGRRTRSPLPHRPSSTPFAPRSDTSFSLRRCSIRSRSATTSRWG